MNNNDYKILLVDDEPDVLEFMGYNLEKEEYTILKAANGEEALHIVKKIRPHLIILDVMMPGQNGIETCKLLRQNNELKDILIIFLSARDDDYTQVEGLEAGADDYIGKPIKPIILKSKIKALLRRAEQNNELRSSIFSFLDVIIDVEKRIIKKNNKLIKLSKKEFDLLTLLISKPNKVFTRNEIFKTVWGDNIIVGDRTIDVHIRRIRGKTGILNIDTVKGVGYKFCIDESL